MALGSGSVWLGISVSQASRIAIQFGRLSTYRPISLQTAHGTALPTYKVYLAARHSIQSSLEHPNSRSIYLMGLRKWTIAVSSN